jgi:hypothetical protein
MTHRVGKGLVVTYGTQVGFRTWTRGTFKLLFNAMYQGPSTPVSDVGAALTAATPADSGAAEPGRRSR